MHCDKFGLKKPIRSGDFKILKFRQCIFAILLSSTLEKRFDPSFEQTWFLINQGCIMQSWIEICQLVLEKKIFYFR